MKRKIAILLAIVMMTMSIGTVAFAADPVVNVSVNGVNLTFNDPTQEKPTIINSRTMVPIKPVADYLGMKLDWNSKTDTMTFTKGSMTSTHKTKTKTIFVNGAQKDFDQPSVIVNSRSMMPLSMLAAMISADISWEPLSKTAMIVTKDGASSLDIAMFEFSKMEVNSGESVTATIMTSKNVTSVRLLSSTDTVVAEKFDYTDTDIYRKFLLTYTPASVTANTTQTLRAVAAVNGVYDLNATRTNSITVRAVNKNFSVISIEPSKTTGIKSGDTVTFAVKATYGTVAVTAVNAADGKSVTEGRATISGGDNLYTFTMTLTKAGDNKITVTPLVSAGSTAIPKDIIVNVTGSSSSSSSTTYEKTDEAKGKTFRITSIHADPNPVRPDRNVKITVVTTNDIDEVTLYDEYDDEIDTLTRYTSKLGSTYFWEFSTSFEDTGTYEYMAEAYSDYEEDYVTKTIDIKVSNTASSSSSGTDEAKGKYLTITSVSVSPKTVKVNGTFVATVKTSDDIYRVRLYDENDKLIATSTKYTSKTGSTLTWTLTSAKITKVNTYDYYVRAYDDYDDYDDYDFEVRCTTSGSSSSSDDPEIIDVEPTSLDVYAGDYIMFTIETTDDVKRVEVRKPNGGIAGYATKYDSKKSGSLYWTVDFKAPNYETEIEYSFYAESSDGDTTYYTTYTVFVTEY